ncbi:L-idonate 5-dehydrogenase [Microlunatus antarcticus]|uniref:L-idonate 5-dehydrogenase n=1 Tax=Microlunatus antarcticus TaxID=53388 RepID=A0A7W5P7Y6_9ACTN|nr:L-idonate 5-dehydrogenase [Microlunatus antarcticus]MBB3328054.1 L-idonate 5-dehydrogenase [Microlunatus antarcticus]
MKAVVVHGAGDLRVDEVDEVEPGPDEVVVDVEWGGICGSDLSYFRHGATGTAVLTEPLVLGHEVAGRVGRLGPGVRDVEVGQPTTVHPATLVGDPALPERLAGRTNLHPYVRYLGSAAFVPHTHGGFVQHLVVRVDQLRVLPDGVDTKRGALAEPLGVAMHAVRRAGDVRSRDVLVNGAGPIGALVVAAAKEAGARTVTVADVDAAALRVARTMGADVTVDVRTASLPEDVELVFEASGATGALGGVLHAVARGGTLVQVGNLPGTPSPAALGDLVTREITWVGSYRFVDEITDAVAAMAAGLDVTPLMTHTFGIDDALEAMQVAADRSTGSSKVMLRLS